MKVGSFTSGGHCLRVVLIYESGGGGWVVKPKELISLSGCLNTGTEKEQQQHSEGCEHKSQGLLLPARVYR